MIRLTTRRRALFPTAAVLTICVAGFGAAGLFSDEVRPSGKGATAAGQEPQYNDQGELKRPTGYEKWIFVGANVGLEYREDADKLPAREAKQPAKLGDFHNVYINPDAYEHYLVTGEFPEKTVLVLDSYKSEERGQKEIVSEGLSPGRQTGLAVAVKNSARPDGGSDWAYFDFGLEAKTAKAFPDSKCYDCHLQHASEDNVWVQFYPILRKAREEPKKRN